MKTSWPLLLGLLLLAAPKAQAQFTYNTNKGTITITGYNGPGGAVTIPSTIHGLPVAGIGADAFSGSDLTTVTIPTNVTGIGAFAFENCASLASLTIPASVTNMENPLFDDCTSLTPITVDPGNLFYSSVNGVLFNESRTTLIECPGGLLGTYTIPNTVTRIGANAFENCTSLTSVTIPNSVTNIADYAFFHCTSLGGVYFEGNAPAADSSVFSEDGKPAVYYLQGTKGWGSTFAGVPTLELTVIFITASPTSGRIPLPVNFTSSGVDSAGNPITSWNWNFGDGSTSTAQNPSHTYTARGTFSVALIETNSNGIILAGSGASITASTPTLAFTANPTTGVVPLEVSFTAAGVDSDGNTISNWNWNFGDGSTSTAQNPSHTYTTIGSFSPALTATNNIGGPVTGSGPSISAEFNPGLVVNGAFATGNFTGWTLIGNAAPTNLVASGSEERITLPLYGNYVAYLGQVGSLGHLSQTLGTLAGVSYSLSLWLDSPDGKTPNEFLVSWNGTTLLDETNISASGWTNLQFLVSATGTNTVLEFGFRDDPSALLLDDISVVPAQLGTASVSLSGANLVLNGTNGQSGGTYYVLTSTNLALPLGQWTPVATYVLSASGNFTITATNTVTGAVPQRFYILKTQ